MPVRVSVGEPDLVNVEVTPEGATVNVGASVVTNYGDYNTITNRPHINGVELLGNKSSADLRIVTIGSTAEWAARTGYIPLLGEIIVYTDHEVVGGITIPAFKVGDGNAYAVDLPFTNDDIRDALENHIEDSVRHITAEERASWNNKVRCFYENETAVFTTS